MREQSNSKVPVKKKASMSKVRIEIDDIDCDFDFVSDEILCLFIYYHVEIKIFRYLTVRYRTITSRPTILYIVNQCSYEVRVLSRMKGLRSNTDDRIQGC